MKRLLPLFLLLSLYSKAQDSIFIAGRTAVFGKVIEISLDSVRYSRNDSMFTIPSVEVARIKFSNGTIDELRERKSTVKENKTGNCRIDVYDARLYVQYRQLIRESKLYAELESKKDEQINLMIGKASRERSRQKVAYLAIPCGVAAAGTFFAATLFGRSAPGVLTGLSVASVTFAGCAISFPIGSAVHFNRRCHFNRKAIELYNASLEPPLEENRIAKIEMHRGNAYTIGDQTLIKEKGLFDILNRSGDEEIITLTRDAKKAKKRTFLMFAFFPTAIATPILLANGFSSFGTESRDYFVAGSACLITAAGSLTYSIKNQKKRVSRTKEAVRLYNLKF